MVKTILAAIASALTLTSFGDVICSGVSATVAIDSRVEPVLDSVEVAWDATWIGGDANATVVIADNGTEVNVCNLKLAWNLCRAVYFNAVFPCD